jgi:hypothetical protein
MIDIDSDRIEYIDQLRPPKNYDLENAVGTTYSLDLVALLGCCLSFAHLDAEQDPRKANRVGLFASLQCVGDKLDVFCEKGRAKNNPHLGEMCVLVERMVHEMTVTPARGRGFASFHPKVWVLEYRKRGAKKAERLYRLLVLSRNLTFDGSWDLGVTLEGEPAGRGTVPSSRPIGDFLRYLARTLPAGAGSRRSRLVSFAGRVEKALFKVDGQNFDGFEFLPIGARDTGLQSASDLDLFVKPNDNVLVMSPFLSEEGPLEKLAPRAGRAGVKRLLLSRQESLDRLDPSVRDRFDCYVPKPWLADVDIEDDGPGLPDATDPEPDASRLAAQFAQLHAKAYLTESDAGRDLYVGSLNASANGMYGNVEALLRLHVKPRHVTFDKFVDALVGDERPFMTYTPQRDVAADEATRVEREFGVRFHIAAKQLSITRATVADKGTKARRGSGSYSIEVAYTRGAVAPQGVGAVPGSADAARGSTGGIHLRLAPFLRQSTAVPIDASAGSACFDDLAPGEVSAFFVLTANDDRGNEGGCLVVCPAERFDDAALPHDDRLKHLLGHLLDRWDGALADYVSYALGFDPWMTRAGASSAAYARAGNPVQSAVGPGMYERLLKELGSDEDPVGRIEAARRMMELIPERFDNEGISSMRNMLDAFDQAARARG